jgi:uncharacterized protein (DUF2252 family)
VLRPFDLARIQIEQDRKMCAWLPVLFERKRKRLRLSPHAFLRGTAGLFYQILADRPELAEGPPGEGTLVGDMHLENVGAYRTDEDELVFDLNDFDDACHGPWRIDLLRALTSALLALHALPIGGDDVTRAASALLRGYRAALFGDEAPLALPKPMAKIVESAKKRSQQELLDARAPKDSKKGTRHFLRGERYLDLTPEISAQLPTLLDAYRAALGPRAPEHAAEWVVEDAAERVAGTGSLGSIRIAFLLKEPSSGNERIIELKQEWPAAIEAWRSSGETRSPAQRVVESARSLVKSPHRFLASLPTTPSGVSFIGRRLFPQEDKLALETVAPDQLEPVSEAVGRMLGRGHARGGPQPRSVEPWSDRDADEIYVRAIEMAGLMEATQHAYTRLI